MYSIGVDTGGTFTDFVIYDGHSYTIDKVLSTPDNPSLAIIEGLKKNINNFSDITELIHGTTVATNALLERKGALTCLITTKGFEDVIEIKRQNRKELYNLFWSPKPPLIPPQLRIGVSERINSKGQILKDIDLEQLEKIIFFIKKNKIESVAVCLLNSYINPENESIIETKLKKLKIPVTSSSQLIPEFREYERTSTTVINSYLIPKVKNYMHSLSEFLPDMNISVIQSNGGLISIEKASNEPVKIILSGPAGGVVGAFKISEITGRNKIITYDMGGTSTDISLCNGDISFTTENVIDDLPIKVPMIDISTIGAGGGSIAYMDEGGALKVGPESAGANPGPSCYGKGEKPTVTDANLVLKRIDPEMFLGGKMSVYPERSYSSITSLGISEFTPEEIAESIIDIANSNMEKALRLISIGKGFDTREFTLVSFGGAGGLHACELARSIGVSEVLFPLNAGALSAYGMLLADSFKDYSLTHFYYADDDVYDVLEKKFEELSQRAVNDFGLKSLSFHKIIDARYKRQSHEISLPFSRNLISDFHLLHKKVYGYCKENYEIEIVTLRLRAYSIKKEVDIPLIKKNHLTIAPVNKSAIFKNKNIMLKIYNRNDFFSSFEFDGPALVLEDTATVFLVPETVSKIDDYGNIITSLI
ncbi:MAG: hydantoinase/oxoprolinase family protein [Thermodesulfobacteriota bacterium]